MSLPEIISTIKADRIFILTDSNVRNICGSLIDGLVKDHAALLHVVAAGEESKGLETAAGIWSEMAKCGLTRRSLMICIGGGMITDLGGFAAACFKRGIPHINIATTLLGAVDASVGGKTGIDFEGLKNEIGAFKMPVATLAEVSSFPSLPEIEILSGFGEVIKTALLASEEMTEKLLSSDPLGIQGQEMEEVVGFCRDFKEEIVKEDPHEKGLRKILNLGHTAGHALESLMMLKSTPVAHGVAVAHGILVALLLSVDIKGLEKGLAARYAQWLKRNYPPLSFTCNDYEQILEIASHDKKNFKSGYLNFVLLESAGSPIYDCPVTHEELRGALDLYQELQGR